MITVFSVQGLVVILLVFDFLRVDVVGLLVMTLLPVTGLLTAGEAVVDLGSNGVVVLICIMVLGTSLDKTGIMGKVKDFGWQAGETFAIFAAESLPQKAGVVKANVSSRSSLNGHTMKELKLRKGYSINPLAIMRGTKFFIEELAGLKLKPGDASCSRGNGRASAPCRIKPI